MKSGWHMEWDVQVAYAAPVRSRLVAMTLAMRPMREVMVRVAASAATAGRAFARAAAQIEAMKR